MWKEDNTMNKLELFCIGTVDTVLAIMVIVVLMTILAIYGIPPF